MNTVKWKNTTKKHPNGVCEAATSIWLERIAEAGIDFANNITPEDCDSLQTKVENGTYTWAVDLLPLLGDKATFHPFEGENPTSEESLLSIISEMSDNDFRFVSATNSWGGGHAVAVYRYRGKYYAFDPNYAIYSCSTLESDLKLLAKQFWSNLRPWSDIAVRHGTIN
jgi:hypothetical protein